MSSCLVGQSKQDMLAKYQHPVRKDRGGFKNKRKHMLYTVLISEGYSCI